MAQRIERFWPGQATASHWQMQFVHFRKPNGNVVDLAERLEEKMAVSK